MEIILLNSNLLESLKKEQEHTQIQFLTLSYEVLDFHTVQSSKLKVCLTKPVCDVRLRRK